MRKGAIIYCEHEGRTSWWFVFSANAGDENSVLLDCAGEGWHSSFQTKFPRTWWDKQIMREQNARYVPSNEVPEHIWAALGEWGLTHAD